MSKLIDLTGQTFDRLAVLRRVENNKWGAAQYKVQCSCTNKTVLVVRGNCLRQKETRSCGCLHKERSSKQIGAKNPNWKGGIKRSGGRVFVQRPSHPYASKQGYVLGYRLKMERRIGRYLRPEEVVHHIDGDKSNDAQGNLMLFANDSEHRMHHIKTRRE